ncbi:hypothetical protein OG828_12045 [Streptomyces sp. NBC_00457]|uniref:hypothetical protein n=1 Tax=Streptomyces sp. NBC_00457 TaxID=2975748 RepID=UPI002E1FAAFE
MVIAALPEGPAAPKMPLESRLEELIEADPAMLGRPLLLVGRQVSTAHGKFIDLLGKRAVPRGQALWRTGFFADQNSACRLRARFTIDEVSRRFGID